MWHGEGKGSERSNDLFVAEACKTGNESFSRARGFLFQLNERMGRARFCRVVRCFELCSTCVSGLFDAFRNGETARSSIIVCKYRIWRFAEFAVW